MAEGQAEGQQHPLSIYFWVWGWLFILSVCSYTVDVLDLYIYLKWFLITLFMIAKAGLIMAVFMHMVWERLSITMVILTPPGVLLLAMTIFALEAQYTVFSRLRYFFGS